VLLVHGNPTWGFYYRSLLRALPPLGLRAIAPDHIGMGRSEKPSTAAYPHTLARRVADFGEFVDGLGLDEPLSLVVHDWGGAIALAWAVDHVDAVDKLLVLNTGAFPIPPGKALPWSLAGGSPCRPRRARRPWAQRLQPRRPRHGDGEPAGPGPRGPRRAHRPVRQPGAPHGRPRVRPRHPDVVRPTRRYAVLARTESRLHLLQGKAHRRLLGMQDPVFDGTVLDHPAHPAPGAEVHRYADAGHYVLEDAATASSRSRRGLLAPA
jgi:haloalkane dehalogenase